MIPNMANTIKRKSLPFIYVKEVVYNGGFEDTTEAIEYSINGVIQIPQDQTLQTLGLDFSINYRQIHVPINAGIIPKNADQIKYKNKKYKVIRVRDFSDYGYYEFIAEELLNGGY